MRNKPVLWCFLGILGLLFVVLGLSSINNMQIKKEREQHLINNISYSQFLKSLNNGEYTVITFDQNNNTVYGDDKEGNKFKTNQLVAHDKIIDIASNKKDIEIKVLNTNESKSNSILMNFLFCFGPFLLLIGFMLYMRKKSLKDAAQANGMNPIHKNPVKSISSELIKTRLSDVAGCDEAKQEVSEIVDFLKNPIKYTKIGAKIPRGVIMSGPPGTGKTLMAKAIAGEAGVPFFTMSGSDFVEMYVGIGAQRVRKLFEQAKKESPCIIFIDEIDAVGKKRSSGVSQSNDEREQTLNALLTEMDGFDNETEIIVVAATNRIDVLDEALIRPGRFDREVSVGYPDVKGREQILKVHSKNVSLSSNVKIPRIALATSGFSGADLANLINEAALIAAREDKEIVEQRHFELAKDKILMGYEKKNLVMSDKNKKLIAYHEAGHAIIALFEEHAAPLEKVTIIPRGRSMGVTIQSQTEDRFGYTENELLAMITGLYGGRVSEELFLGEISTGASNDIERATSIAKSMVTEYGMSGLGPIHFGEKTGTGFKNDRGGGVNTASGISAGEIDKEVKRIIEQQYNKTKEILLKYKNEVVLLADELLIKESLDLSDINILLGLENLDLEKKSEKNVKIDVKSKNDGEFTSPINTTDENLAMQ